MTDIKHAPGPWVVGHNNGSHVEIDAPSHGALANVVWLMDDDRDEKRNSPRCEANAHLIAAAPALLEALRRLANEVGGMPQGDIALFVIEIADAAIAKAEGTAR